MDPVWTADAPTSYFKPNVYSYQMPLSTDISLFRGK